MLRRPPTDHSIMTTPIVRQRATWPTRRPSWLCLCVLAAAATVITLVSGSSCTLPPAEPGATVILGYAADNGVVTQLVSTMLGMAVQAVVGAPFQLTPLNHSNVLDTLGTGLVHVTPMIWPLDEYPDGQLLLYRGGAVLPVELFNRTAESFGVSGVQGRLGWYVSSDLLQAHPTLNNWTALRDPTIAALFKQGGANGILMTGPSSSAAQLACGPKGQIATLGLNLQCAYFTSNAALEAAIVARLKARLPVLALLRYPSPLTAFNLTRVALPILNHRCWSNAIDARRGLACDFPTEVAEEGGWLGFRTFFTPDIFDLMYKFQVSSQVVVQLLPSIRTSADVSVAACKWVLANLGYLNSLIAKLHVTSVQPELGPVEGGYIVTVTGSNFGIAPPPQLDVLLADVECPATWISNTRLTFTAPEGVGANVSLVVRAGSRKSPAMHLFSYAPAVLRSVAGVDGTRQVFDGEQIVVIGDGFSTTGNSYCQFGGTAVVAAFINSSAISCTAPAYGTGVMELRVSNDGLRWSDGFVSFTSVVWPGSQARVPLGFDAQIAPPNVYVLAVVSKSGASYAAMQLALQDIKAADTLLPFTTLNLLVVDSDSIKAGGVQAAVDAVLANYPSITISGVIGTESFVLTDELAALCAARRWAQVIYDTGTNFISLYPKAIALTGSQLSFGSQASALLQILKSRLIEDGFWTTTQRSITIVSASDTVSLLLRQQVLSALSSSVNVTTIFLTSNDGLSAAVDLQPLQRSAGRQVVMLIADDSAAQRIMAAANTAKLIGPTFLWVGTEWIDNDWSSLGTYAGATGTATYNALFGTLGIIPVAGNSTLAQRVKNAVAYSSRSQFNLAPFAYDAVQLYAQAIDAMVRGGAYTQVMDSTLVWSYMTLVNFQGATGQVAFTVDDHGLATRAFFAQYSIAAISTAGRVTTVGAISSIVELTAPISRPASTATNAQTTWQYSPPPTLTIGLSLSFGASIDECPECHQVVAAVQLAVDEVNAASDVLPDTTVKVVVLNSQHTTTGAGPSILAGIAAGVDMFLGDLFSFMVLKMVPVAQQHNKVILGFASTSPQLSNTQAFPLFARTVASDQKQGEFAVDLLRRYNWRLVASIAINEPYASQLAQVFQASAPAWNIKVGAAVVLPATMATSGIDPNVYSGLKQIQAAGIKVIYLAALADPAKQVLLTAVQMNMTGGDYVWIGCDGWIYDLWSSSAPEQRAVLVKAMDGAIGLIPSYTSPKTPEFLRRLYVEENKPLSPAISAPDPAMLNMLTTWRQAGHQLSSFYPPYAYDAAHVAMLAVDAMIKQSQDLEDAAVLHQFLLNTQYQGTTGLVKLSTLDNSRQTQTYDFVNLHNGVQTTAGLVTDRGFIQYSVCLPGNYRTVDAQGLPSTCAECPVDTYKDLAGDFECLECPRAGNKPRTTNGTTGAVSGLACLCPVAFYTDINIVGTDGLQHCVQCDLVRSVCDVVGTTLAQVQTATGYWRAHPNATAFIECPVERSCGQASVVQVNLPIDRMSKADQLAVWYWNAKWYKSTNCTNGHAGVLCLGCAFGYGRSILDSTGCALCPSIAENLAILCVAALVLALMISYLVVEATHMDVVRKRRANNLKVLVSYFQLNSLCKDIQTRWSTGVITLLQLQGLVTSPTAVSLLSFDCALPPDIPRSFRTFMFMVFLPILVMLLFLAFRIALKLWVRYRRYQFHQAFGSVVDEHIYAKDALDWNVKRTGAVWDTVDMPPSPDRYHPSRAAVLDISVRRQIQAFRQKKHKLTDYSVIFVIICLFVIYPTLTQTVLQMFSCTQVTDGLGSTGSFLTADARVNCYNPTYWMYRYSALGALFLYVLGIPLVAFLVLWSQRYSLHLADANGAENLLFDEAVLDALEEKIELVAISNESALDMQQRMDCISSFCDTIAEMFDADVKNPSTEAGAQLLVSDTDASRRTETDLAIAKRVLWILHKDCVRHVSNGLLPTAALQQAVMRFRRVFRVQQRFGILFTAYRPAFVYWELVIMLRKAIVSAISVLMSDAFAQVACAQLLLTASLMLNQRFEPFCTTESIMGLASYEPKRSRRMSNASLADTLASNSLRSVDMGPRASRLSFTSLVSTKLQAVAKVRVVKLALTKMSSSTSALEKWSLLLTFITLCLSQLYTAQQVGVNALITVVLFLLNVVIILVIGTVVLHDTNFKRYARRIRSLFLSCFCCTSCTRRRLATDASTVPNPMLLQMSYADRSSSRGRSDSSN